MSLPDDFTDDPIYAMLDELRLCLCAAIGDAAPCFCGIIVGDGVPVEYAGDCDNCGAAYVRVVTAFPSTAQFPAPDQTAQCSSVWAYQLAVGIVRCTPVGDNSGEPPTPEEVTDTSRRALKDIRAIRKAITCCFATKFEDLNYTVGAFTPAPGDGGVSGGEIQVIIQESF